MSQRSDDNPCVLLPIQVQKAVMELDVFEEDVARKVSVRIPVNSTPERRVASSACNILSVVLCVG